MSRLRLGLERLAHTMSLVILTWLLVRAFIPSQATPRLVDSTSLDSALAHWSTAAEPATVHVRVANDVSPARRDWIAAMNATTTHVTWEAGTAIPSAAVAEPVAEPGGATSVRASAPTGTNVVLADALGELDSVRSLAGGVRFIARSAPPRVMARAGALVARSALRDSLLLRKLLVLGEAGWESKFVLAALEEAGWNVDTRLALSPQGNVRQYPAAAPARGRAPGAECRVSSTACGAPSPLDTSHYSAVIALDSSALADAPGIIAYVRRGGGLVISAALASASAFHPLNPGGQEEGALDPVVPVSSDSSDPRRALALMPIALRSDAVPVEYRDTHVAVAGRRVERGRVVIIGYRDTWRWRMGGGAGAVQQHRAWWSDLVASVAYAGRVRRNLTGIDEAPYAHLVERLGAPLAPAARGPARVEPPVSLLFTLFAAGLLLNWTSRRLRGSA